MCLLPSSDVVIYWYWWVRKSVYTVIVTLLDRFANLMFYFQKQQALGGDTEQVDT